MRVTRIKRNTIASVSASLWQILIGLVALPIYIRFLGDEQYGILGVYYIVLAVTAALDLGVGPTLSRQIARDGVGPDGPNADRGGESAALAKSFETFYWITAGAIALVVSLLLAPIAAHGWLGAGSLDRSVVYQSIVLIGVSTALRFPAALYLFGMMGQQRHASAHAFTIVSITLQAGAALTALAFIAADIRVMLGAFILASAIHTLVFAVMFWRGVESGRPRRGARNAEVFKHLGYIGGVGGIYLTSALLAHTDRLVLSALLSLAVFGQYTLASRASTLLGSLVTPLIWVLFPRFSEMIKQMNQPAVTGTYHRACQVVAVIAIPPGLVLALYPEPLLNLWLQDAPLARQAAPFVTALAIGQTLNSLAAVPIAVQLAYGWSSLILLTNAAAIFLMPPLVIGLHRLGGAEAAAWSLACLNAGLLAILVPTMHSKILKGQLRAWASIDIGLPVALAAALGWLSVNAKPDDLSPIAQMLWAAVLGAVTTAALVVALPQTRAILRRRSAAEGFEQDADDHSIAPEPDRSDTARG